MCVTLRQPLHNDVCQINYDRISNGFNDTEPGSIRYFFKNAHKNTNTRFH